MGTTCRSNCLIFAFAHWWKEGGYVVMRKSDMGWWPHFMWTLDLLTFEEFTPLLSKTVRRFPPVLFRGIVRRAMPPGIR